MKSLGPARPASPPSCPTHHPLHLRRARLERAARRPDTLTDGNSDAPRAIDRQADRKTRGPESRLSLAWHFQAPSLGPSSIGVRGLKGLVIPMSCHAVVTGSVTRNHGTESGVINMKEDLMLKVPMAKTAFRKTPSRPPFRPSRHRR